MAETTSTGYPITTEHLLVLRKIFDQQLEVEKTIARNTTVIMWIVIIVFVFEIIKGIILAL